MSFQPKKRLRKPSCTLCANHGIRSDLKGHKYHCKYSDCECKLCDQGRERREVMRKQVKLRRHQMREFPGYGGEQSSGKVNAGLKLTPPPRMMPSTNIEHRSQAPVCNISPGYSTFARFNPTRMMSAYNPNIPTEAMTTAFLVTMSPNLSPQYTHSPLHRRVSPVNQLSVSDNSAFVRISPQSNQIHGAISDVWPASCEVGDPKEAAYALASLQHKTKKLRLKKF